MANKRSARLRPSPFRGFVLLPVVFATVFLIYLIWPAGGKTIVEIQAIRTYEDEADVRRCHWKPNESLAGYCPGDPLKSVKGAGKTAADCSAHCCASETCVAWQFRSDMGCLEGPDVRLGLEKDGTPEWCEPTAPSPWQGERLPERHNAADDDNVVDVPVAKIKACGLDWKPGTLSGQCFGLGPLRPNLTTPDQCRQACCDDKDCLTWQFREDKGCFYGGWVGRCDDSVNAHGAFIGRRKIVEGRKYTDHKGRPVSPVTPWPGLPD